MNQSSNIKPVYDLEERTYLFAKNVRQEMKKVKKYFFNEDLKILYQEAVELKKIFSSIIEKSK